MSTTPEPAPPPEPRPDGPAAPPAQHPFAPPEAWETTPTEGPSAAPQAPPHGTPPAYGTPPPPPGASYGTPSPPPYGAPPPPGAPPYGAPPPPGAPPYGSPGAPPYGYGPYRPSFDGFAIAGFIFSIIAWVLVSIPLAIVGLRRTRGQARRGRGLAVAALVISGVWIVLITLAVVVAALTSAQRDSSGRVTRSGSVAITDLRVGDCLRTAPDLERGLKRVDVTPCDGPHRAEVYAAFDLPDGSYPGEEQVQTLADRGCQDRTPRLPNTGARLRAFYLYPLPTDWNLGDREVNCLVVSPTDLQSRLSPADT